MPSLNQKVSTHSLLSIVYGEGKAVLQLRVQQRVLQLTGHVTHMVLFISRLHDLKVSFGDLESG